MRKIFNRSMLVFFLVASVWNCHMIAEDLKHPEIWDQDWRHDPRIWLPALGEIAVLYAAFGAHIWRVERRDKRCSAPQRRSTK